jgi:hypothetical protein
MTLDLWALAWPILFGAAICVLFGIVLGFLIYLCAARRARGRHRGI